MAFRIPFIHLSAPGMCMCMCVCACVCVRVHVHVYACVSSAAQSSLKYVANGGLAPLLRGLRVRYIHVHVYILFCNNICTCRCARMCVSILVLYGPRTQK